MNMLEKNSSCTLDLLFISLLFWVLYNGLWIDFPLFLPDEGRYSEISQAMLRTGDFVTPRLNGLVFVEKPVGYFWVEALSFAGFGASHWAARFPNVCFAFLGVLAGYYFAGQWFNRKTAFLSACILMTTPFYFGAAHYANLDMSLAVLVSLSLSCLITGLLHKKPRFFYGAYFFAGCAFLIKGLIALVFPVLLVMVWMMLKKRWQVLLEIHLFSGVLLFLAVILPWCVLIQMENPRFFEFFFLHEQFGRYLSQADFNNKSPIWFFIPVVFIGILPWTFLFLRAVMTGAHLKTGLARCYFYFVRAPHHHKIEITPRQTSSDAHPLLLIWIAVVLIFFSIPQSKLVGYALPVIPPIAILTAHFISERWEKLNTTFYVHLFLGVVLLVVFLCSVPLLQKHSTRDLSLKINAFLMMNPKTEVVLWKDYSYDLPFYLNRVIPVAGEWRGDFHKDNWQRELVRAARITPNQRVLVEKKDFLNAAREGKKPILLVVPEYLASEIKKPFVMKWKQDGYVMFTQS